VTHDRQKLCNLLLSHLKSQEVKPDEVIIIDDYSKVPFKVNTQYNGKITLLRSKRELGLGTCRNIGVIVAKGDILVFIDDDALPQPNWLKEILLCFEQHNVDIVGGLAVPLYLIKPPYWWDSNILGKYLAINNRTIVGCNFAVRREVFKEVGLFNIKLGRYKKLKLSNEEIDFLLRAFVKGINMKYLPKAKVYHVVTPRRLTLTYLIRRAWYQGISTYILSLFQGKSPLHCVLIERKMDKYISSRGMKLEIKKNFVNVIFSLVLSQVLLFISLIGCCYASLKYREQ